MLACGVPMPACGASHHEARPRHMEGQRHQRIGEVSSHVTEEQQEQGSDAVPGLGQNYA